MIGPREAPRLWQRHLVNSALLGEVIPTGDTVCDLGTGAGLPGLVLALSRPDLSLTLVEPLLRRTSFLHEVISVLGLPNVEVIRARAEELHGGRTFSVVTSRALAPLERLLGWSMPLVSPGGALVAMKGASVHREVEAAAAALRGYDAGSVTVSELGTGLIDPPTTVLRVESGHPAGIGSDGPGERVRGTREGLGGGGTG